MQTVYKYPLSFLSDDRCKLQLPRGAKLLSIARQDTAFAYNSLQLWALVDPNESIMERRTIRVAGAGHPLPDFGLEYITTILDAGGSLVWHFFEEKE